MAFVAAALIVVPSATPQTVVGRTVVRALALPAGTTRSVSISCPAGYFALSAGASKAGRGITTLTDRPLGLRTFSLRLSNAGDADQRVTVAAACRRVRAAGRRTPHLKLLTRRRVTLRVSPTSQRQTHLTCPSGTVPAAAGFDAGRRDVTVRDETQDLHTLSFSAYNRSTTARTVAFYVGCLTVVRPAGASPAQLQVSLATDTVPIPSGSEVVTRTCPQGWLSLSVGYSVPVGLDLNGAAAAGRTGRWSFTNTAQKPVLAQVQLACARLT